MKIYDIINEAIEKKISYPEAIEALKKLKLPPEEEDKFEIMLYKLLGKEERLVHNKIEMVNVMPNELYFEVLQDCISKIREEWYTPEVCKHLLDTYGISYQLITYFVNESISIVRMNSLQPDEVKIIGESYYKALSFLENKYGKDPKMTPKNLEKKLNKKIEIDTQIINAEEVEEISVISDNDIFDV